jgi:trehalose-6-phosphate synthase
MSEKMLLARSMSEPEILGSADADSVSDQPKPRPLSECFHSHSYPSFPSPSRPVEADADESDDDFESEVSALPTTRLVLVSNRLPVTFKVDEDGEYSRSDSSGGLATGLAGPHKATNGLWIGWPGDVSALENEKIAEIDEELRGMNFAPVHLTPDQVDGFYTTFCNGSLWPLFHYLLEKVQLDARSWEDYCTVNRLFADAVCAHLREGDLVWVHDYQLFLVPQMVRKEHPRAKIGFFLHIPFPSSEVFRILPWRTEVLNGILGSDVIGFHSPTYAPLQHATALCGTCPAAVRCTVLCKDARAA